MKRTKVCIIALIVLMLVCENHSIVSAGNESSVVNHVSTGIVDIELSEYQIKDGKEVKWQDNPLVLPGTNVSKIPRIHNYGNDCYVRAKVSFRDIVVNLEKNIYGMGNDWVKKNDGYYYYTKILRTEENVDLFRGILIPPDFPQTLEGRTFYLDLSVDAIQSQNFTPDFSAALPWGSVKIVQCDKQGPYNVTSFEPGENKMFLIEYQGESEELFLNEEDFFQNFSVLMPGDEYKDSVEIRNSSESDVNLYFRSEIAEENLSEEIELLITTEVNGQERMLYKGPLRAESLSENRLLVNIPGGVQGKLNYTVTVPEELGNTYAAEECQVKWIFSTEPGVRKTQTVRTGDSRNVEILLLLAVFSLVSIVVIVVKRKRHCEKNSRYDC